MKFIAASKDRVYGEDRSGNVVVLHAQTGGRLDVIPAAGLPIKLMNLQTDRIYLAAETGLIQCFHEIELATPILHRPKPVPKQEKPKPKKTEVVEPARPKAPPTAAGGAAPADSPFGAGGVDPFGGGAAPADSPFGSGGGGAPADNPFGGGTDPFGGGTAPADNPFGGASGGGGTPANDPFG
jgi:hypothetical protein